MRRATMKAQMTASFETQWPMEWGDVTPLSFLLSRAKKAASNRRSPKGLL
jgi:hypothetical protein